MALDRIGDYSAHEHLARSGRDADFFRGERGSKGAGSQPVLLKVLRAPSPTAIAWLRREHEILAGLDAPTLLRPVELVQAGERWGIAFEDRGTAPLQAGEPLPLELFCLVAARAGRALAELHRHGLAHLRLAPQNLLFDRASGLLELADLSQAAPFDQWLPGHEAWSEDSLPYISPEHTGRVGGSLDARSDLYSLGATLFHLLCGKPPFDARERAALIHAHIAREAPDARVGRPETPELLAQILARLLRKQPEERYQSSEALALDLERCLVSYERSGRIESFPIGASDRSRRLVIPSTLYGRAADLAQIEALSERVPGRALALIRGPAGIGKSTLVRRALRAHLGRGGRFASGKYDQYRGDVLYGAFAEALRGLVRGLLAEPDAQLRQTRIALQLTLGENAAALTELVPELAHLVKTAPALTALGPAETAHRFRETLLAFLRPLATPERPLVLFMDDLQWAAPSSLELIELLLSDEELKGLLLIGAYRDDEVGPGSPLHATLRRSAAQQVCSKDLGPLDLDSVQELLSGALGQSQAEVEPLARSLHTRSGGNPFALRELLAGLQREGLLSFSSDSTGWSWKPPLGGEPASLGDVLDELAADLSRLPAPTQSLLQAAACIGAAFSLETLALASEEDQAEVEVALLPARNAQVIRAATRPVVVVNPSGLPTLVVPRYEFRHDRLQQAAYSLAPPERRRETHLRLGRLLRKAVSPGERGALLEVTAQLNAARELIVDREERDDLARLDLEAAQLARESTAWRDALRFVEISNELIEVGQSPSELVFAIRRELALARFLRGDFDGVEALVAETLPHLAEAPQRRAILCNQLVVQRTTQGRYAEAIQAGRAALAELGVELADGDPTALRAALTGELDALEALRAGRSFEQLALAPSMNDPSLELALEVLVNLDSAAYLSDLDLYALVVVKMVGISLSAGPVPESAKAYASFGIVLGPLLGRYAEAHSYAELGIAISERFAHKGQECRACHTMANHVLAWVRPIREANAYNARGYAVGYEAGEILWAGFIQLFKLYNRFFEGRPLAELLSDAREALAYCRTTRNQIGIDSVEGFLLALQGLRGDGVPQHAHATFVAQCEARGSAMALGLYTCVQAEVELILGRPERARARCEEAEPLLPFILGVITVAGHNLTDSLVRLCGSPLSSDDAERVARNQRTLEAWAESCPGNFRARWLLVRGEEQRQSGDLIGAGTSLDEAAALAARSGFPQVQALAHERQASLWAGAGKPVVASVYGREAVEAYARWGAHGKAQALRQRYPTQPQDAPTLAGLDLDSFTEASRAISSELDRSRLVPRILQIIVEAAGAEWGFLILDGDAGLQVEAVSGPPGAHCGPCPGPVAAHPQLSQSVVRYTFRSAEEVSLGDVSAGGLFSDDPCLLQRGVRSLLALPVTDQGRARGVLYLTNEMVVGAFDAGRRLVVRMLLAQAAVSLTNAELVAQLERTSEALRADVVARELAERERSTLEDEVRQLQKLEAVGSLAAGIAHDFNNLLAAIFGYTELALSEVGDPHTRELLDQVLLAGRQARELVRQILSFSRQDTGELVRADLRTVLEDVASLLRSSARPDLVIQCRVPDEPLSVATRRAELHQVVMNLCTNAIQAMEGKGRLEVSLSRQELGGVTELGGARLAPGAYALLRVEDEGPGMPAEVLEQIFRAFFTTKGEGQGTGIGLAVVSRIVSSLGGAVLAESELGVGSVFLVYLPLSGEGAADADQGSPRLVPVGRGERLLFVDDEASITRLAEALLRALGFEVHTYTDSLLALEVLREDPEAWDLVISDVRMPGINGIELASAVARLREDLPILLMTGQGAGGEAALLSEGTIQGILTKPFSSAALREAILVALAERPALPPW